MWIKKESRSIKKQNYEKKYKEKILDMGERFLVALKKAKHLDIGNISECLLRSMDVFATMAEENGYEIYNLRGRISPENPHGIILAEIVSKDGEIIRDKSYFLVHPEAEEERRVYLLPLNSLFKVTDDINKNRYQGHIGEGTTLAGYTAAAEGLDPDRGSIGTTRQDGPTSHHVM